MYYLIYYIFALYLLRNISCSLNLFEEIVYNTLSTIFFGVLVYKDLEKMFIIRSS